MKFIIFQDPIRTKARKCHKLIAKKKRNAQLKRKEKQEIKSPAHYLPKLISDDLKEDPIRKKVSN